MTTYYVRKNGADGSAGTSSGAAWLTVAHALATVAAGDTVYIGAGVYREALIASTSFGSDTFFIGDYDGAQTGDAGEVRITNFTTDSRTTAPSGATVQCRGKNHYYWKRIVFVSGGANNACIDAVTTTAGGTNWTFDDCALLATYFNFQAGCLQYTAIVDTPAHWAFNRCLFWNNLTNIAISGPSSASADYNLDIAFNNCRIITHGGSDAIKVTGTGANSFKAGGVTVQSCTLMGTFRTAGANLISTTFPCTVYDSTITSAAAVAAATSGQIVEDYNFLNSGRTSVTAGTHSVIGQYESLFHVGQERIWGGRTRPYMEPVLESPLLNFGNLASAPSPFTVDERNLARPSTATRTRATGTATAGAATTITDSGATWLTNQFVGSIVKLTGGTGSGQVKTIKSNTGTALTVYGNWATTPDATSTYAIVSGPSAETGKATSASSTTLVQSTCSWTTNCWTGYTLEITGGTGSGQTNTIASNTTTTLTVNTTWGTNPDSTSTYSIYRQTSVNAELNAAGSLERHSAARKETTLTDAGSVAWALYGYADQEIRIPVDATSTTIAVKVSFDTPHGNTNKPQAILEANGEIGVSTETKTATGTAGSGTFESLTFTPISPSAKGVVTVRLYSRSDNHEGRAVFDTVSVS